MSATTLEVPNAAPLSNRTYHESAEKEADFLTLRLLNKRVRARLSPQPIELDRFEGKGAFLAIANTKGWFAAVIHKGGSQYQIICSPLVELRTALTSSTLQEGYVPFEPKRVLDVAPAIPTHLALTPSEDRLVVGTTQGPIAVYDTAHLFSASSQHVPPLHTFPPTSSGSIQQILPNPGDLPDLIAIRRTMTGNGPPVEVYDVRQMRLVASWQPNAPASVPTTISWSPKGKQLAIGIKNGDIITFSPGTTSPKLHVSKPPQAGDAGIVSVTWLTNTAFYSVFTPSGSMNPETDQKHYIVNYDSKTNSGNDVLLSTPCYSSPGLRPPGVFPVIFKSWNPSKVLIFVGDGPSSDIGLIGCLPDPSTGAESWSNFSLEETSTPSLPLDHESNDTVLLGFELDLTNTQSVKAPDERPDFPPPPIMYAYVSDGTVQAWYVINNEGSAYPGMAGSTASLSTSNALVPSSASTSPFLSTQPVAPAFGSSGFGQQATSVFGSAQPQSSSPFGSSAPAFGQSSAFGSQQPPQSAFGSTAKPGGGFGGGGFAAFSSAPSGFGSNNTSGFTSNATPMKPSISDATMNTPTAETPTTEMSDTGAGFGGLSLGESSSQSPSKLTGSSVFGTFANTAPAAPSNTSGFGSSGFGNSGFGGGMRPAMGFGAFSNQTTQQPAASTPEPAKASSAFGSSGFGQSSFGQSAFSQPAFGKSAFATSANTTSAFGGSGKGGFGAFASSGATGFGAGATTNVFGGGIFKTDGSSGSSGFGSGGSVFGGGATPAFGSQGSSVFGAPKDQSTNEVTTQPALQNAGTPQRSAPESANATKQIATRPITPESPSPSPSPPLASSIPPTNTAFVSSTPSNAFSTTQPKPAQGFGAFGGQWSSSSAFKPATGFGAFGAQSSSGSAFFSPKATPTVNAFSGGAFSTPATPEKGFAANPSGVGASSAFGKTGFGTPGFGQTGFGSVQASDKPPEVVKATSAFSAFTGTSGFTSLATGPKSSFSDLLKGKDATPEKSSAESSTTGKPTPKEQKKEDTEEEEKPKTSSIFAAPTRSGIFGPKPDQNLVQSAFNTKPPVVSVFAVRPVETKEDTKVKTEPDSEAKELSESFTLGSVSSALSSSFVDVPSASTQEEEEEEAEEEEEEGSEFEDGEVEEEGQEGYQDDVDSFLSSSLEDEDQSEHEEGGEVPSSPEAESVTPVNIPLPASNSGSASPLAADSEQKTPSLLSRLSPLVQQPTAEPANIPLPASREATPQPSPSKPSELPTEARKDTPSREQSTTPPGSPDKLSPALVQTPTAAPPSGSSSSMGNLGIGKPSNRPSRSSPLAGVPVSGEESDEGESTTSAKPALEKPKSASPKPASEAFPKPKAEPGTTAASTSQTSKQEQKPSVFGSFSLTPATPPSNSTSTSRNIFSVPDSSASPPAFTLPSKPTPTPGGSGGLFFGKSPPAASTSQAPQASLFSQQKSTPRSPFSFSSPTTNKPSIPLTGGLGDFGNKFHTSVTQVTPPENPMAEELLRMYQSVTQRLKKLEEVTIEFRVAHKKRYASTNITKTKVDLGDTTKWSLGDADNFGELLRSLEKDVLDIYKFKEVMAHTVTQIESQLLKAEARKEEILRFMKAKTDPEFAKALKQRSMEPDYTEMQNSLRNRAQAIYDQINQAEDILKRAKKKLAQSKASQASQLTTKPPSLETINRTFRDIDSAINEESEKIARLTSRVSKLKLGRSSMASPRRSYRAPTDEHSYSSSRYAYPEPPSRDSSSLHDLKSPPRGVTRGVAINTAAALNAERSALRLKNALAKTHRKPILTESRSSISPHVLTDPYDKYPIQSQTRQPPLTPLPISGNLFGDTYVPVPRPPSTNLFGRTSNNHTPTSPLAESSTLSGGGGDRSNRAPKAHHSKSVPLRRDLISGQANEKIVSFDWGPLPGVPPMSSIPSDVRSSSPAR